MSNEYDKNIEMVDEESSIDFDALWQSIKSRKKLYAKVLGITFVLICVYAFSIPKSYVCEVTLAPESSSSGSRASSLGALASTFGMNLGNLSGRSSSDALYPTLYPDLMNSVDFKTRLFSVKVRRDKETEKDNDGDDEKEMTYYEYLLDGQRVPWWGAALKFVGDLFKSDSIKPEEPLDPFRLTKKQARVAKMIDKKVVCEVDKKTSVITITVTDQDPLICATMADSVQQRLQQYITDYRTSKARKDLEYEQKIFMETKRDYDKARQLYADYSDANQDVILQSVKMKLTDLENDMQLKFNIYNTSALQVQAAKAKVQEETPSFTTLQSATVPLNPDKPKKKQLVLIALFVAFMGTTVWAFHKDGLLKPLLGL